MPGRAACTDPYHGSPDKPSQDTPAYHAEERGVQFSTGKVLKTMGKRRFPRSGQLSLLRHAARIEADRPSGTIAPVGRESARSNGSRYVIVDSHAWASREMWAVSARLPAPCRRDFSGSLDTGSELRTIIRHPHAIIGEGNAVLSKTGLHAVRAMVALARLRGGGYAGAARIAQEIGAPQNYLGKLLKALAEEGLVESQKGLGGGFRLSGDPKKISLFDIVEPIDRFSRWSGCILGWPECSESDPCALHHRWKSVRNGYLQMLKRTTIADLVAKGELQAINL